MCKKSDENTGKVIVICHIDYETTVSTQIALDRSTTLYKRWDKTGKNGTHL